MPVSSVNFRSSAGHTPLKNDSHVSFAKRQEETAKTENKNSNKAAYVATGVGLAAAVAAGIVFRKPIGNFVKSLKLPTMAMVKDTTINAAKTLKNGVNKAVTFVKTKGAEVVKNLKDKFKNVNVHSSFTGVFANVKTKAAKIAKFAFGKVVEGAKFVKNLSVTLWDKAVEVFNKAAHKA